MVKLYEERRKSPAAEYIRSLEELTASARHRRRRRGTVPVYEWTFAFAMSQKLVTAAYNKAVDELSAKGIEMPPLYGALLRVALNRYILPALRKYLAMKRGIETPEEVVEVVKRIVDLLLNNPEKVKELVAEYLERYGIPKDLLEEYINYTMEILPLMKKYFDEVAPAVVQEVIAKYGRK